MRPGTAYFFPPTIRCYQIVDNCFLNGAKYIPAAIPLIFDTGGLHQVFVDQPPLRPPHPLQVISRLFLGNFTANGAADSALPHFALGCPFFGYLTAIWWVLSCCAQLFSPSSSLDSSRGFPRGEATLAVAQIAYELQGHSHGSLLLTQALMFCHRSCQWKQCGCFSSLRVLHASRMMRFSITSMFDH